MVKIKVEPLLVLHIQIKYLSIIVEGKIYSFLKLVPCNLLSISVVNNIYSTVEVKPTSFTRLLNLITVIGGIVKQFPPCRHDALLVYEHA